ncbi:MAG: hypothetical protein WAV89_08010, partial [Ignavibacteriaceae bacterium]
ANRQPTLWVIGTLNYLENKCKENCSYNIPKGGLEMHLDGIPGNYSSRSMAFTISWHRVQF